jgi:hypothetical protein
LRAKSTALFALQPLPLAIQYGSNAIRKFSGGHYVETECMDVFFVRGFGSFVVGD